MRAVVPWEDAVAPLNRKPRFFMLSSNLYSQFPAMFPNASGALVAFLRREGYEVDALHLEQEREIKQIIPRLRAFNPDVVGFTCMSPEERLIEPMAALSKQWNPEVPFLVGGVYAVLNSDETVRTPNVDAVCTGEGEYALLEYLQRYERGDDVTETPNFAFLKDGEVVRTRKLPFIKDLDVLPWFDRSVADLNLAIRANHGTLNLVFGRGCPHRCRFCGNRHLRDAGGGGVWARMPSVKRAIDEIEHLSKSYKFREIVIRDDTFAWDRKWAEDFLDEYARRFKYPIHIFTRVDVLDEALVQKLKKAHCSCVFIGLDAGHPDIRNGVLDKGQDNDDLLRTTRLLKAAGITPVISNIVGLPFETAEQHEVTVALNKEIYKDQVVFVPSFGAVPKIWVFSPWRGSDLHKLCREKGWLKEDANQGRVYRDVNMNMPDFPAPEVMKAFRTFRYKVYKDNFPVWALIFLAFDSAPAQYVYERIPLAVIGQFRDGLRRTLNLFLGDKGAFKPV